MSVKIKLPMKMVPSITSKSICNIKIHVFRVSLDQTNLLCNHFNNKKTLYGAGGRILGGRTERQENKGTNLEMRGSAITV